MNSVTSPADAAADPSGHQPPPKQARTPPPRPATSPRLAGLCGVVATGTGLAAAALVAQATGPGSAPVTAIGNRLIDLMPAPLVNWGKETLGHADKPVLLVIVTLVALALGALAGLLAARRRHLGWVVIAPLAALSLLAASTDPAASFPSSLVPTLVALVVAVPLLSALVERAHSRTFADGTPDTEARRRFLTLLGGATTAAVVGVGAERVIDARVGAGSDAGLPPLPTPSATEAVPAGAELGIAGLSPYVTPAKDFYRIDTALVVPRVSATKWTLSIVGQVRKPVTIDYATLLSRGLVEHVTTLTCVSNEVGGNLAGNAVWLGLPVRELLAEAEPLPGADMVLSRSADGWTAGTPLEALTDPHRQALLAVGMNGKPLPREHGYPVRMVVPGLYGYVSATKWVVELKVTSFAADQGYWTPLGWSAKGPIKLASRIDVPVNSGTVPSGDVVVAGVAWAQHTGVRAVEVRVDEGPWQPATLAEVTSADTWRQWHWTWPSTRGRHLLQCRAQDATGAWQTEDQAPPAPDGATGLHSVDVVVG
ncbi:molybdopterin-dependent oxidoreductase [Aestuariimicrobium kwangyangense]|uniref:molybdopterin-dependent oxidoreductase n=1 Tax=Aestuariimicrobium kwangyangense TaxID=396389 RepID=UPI0004187674|nr:molybdopterin-dependent oxidoreductase [Aestuariimicrobium kwangyangense]